MALNYDNVNAFVHKYLSPTVEDNIFESSYGFQWIRDKALDIQGGETITFPLLYAKTKASGGVAGHSILKTEPTTQFTRAEYQWRTQYVTVDITQDEEDKVDAAGNLAVAKLMQQKVKAGELTLIDDLGNALFNDGSDSLLFEGARKIINKSRALGGIPSTETFFDANLYEDTTNYSKANLKDPSGSYYLGDLMRTVWQKCTKNRQQPDLILCSEGFYNIYEGILEGKQETGTDRPPSGDLGFQVLYYKKKPVALDDLCPASWMFFFNSNAFKMVLHSKNRFHLSEWVRPANQFVKYAQMSVKGNFTSANCRYLGAIHGAADVG